MNIRNLVPVLLLACFVTFSGCKEKDSKIQTRVEEKLQPNQETSGVRVTVNDGVATLNGEVKTENGRIESENIAKGTKGVKSVVNNLTVTPVMVAPPTVEIAADDALTASVRDAIKDHPGVTATVVNGTVTLSGNIRKSDNMILMQKINGLRPGKVDNSGLTVNP